MATDIIDVETLGSNIYSAIEGLIATGYFSEEPAMLAEEASRIIAEENGILVASTSKAFSLLQEAVRDAVREFDV